MEKQWKIRMAVPEDAQKLLAIYAPYVKNTAISFEYEVPSEEEFSNRIRKTLERYPYIVMTDGNEIIGYAYASSFHAREAYDWCVETSIYVAEEKRRSGAGRYLYEALEVLLKEQHVLNMNACIAYINQADEHLNQDSCRFHERMGYRMVGRFDKCGYKFGRWYDMVWMEKHIGEHTEKPEAFIPRNKL